MDEGHIKAVYTTMKARYGHAMSNKDLGWNQLIAVYCYLTNKKISNRYCIRNHKKMLAEIEKKLNL